MNMSNQQEPGPGKGKTPKTTRLKKIKGDLRQAMQPKPFRIHSLPEWPAAQIKKDGKTSDAGKTNQIPESPSGAGPETRENPVALLMRYEREMDKLLRLLADVANGLWRMKGRLVEEKTGAPLDGLEKVYRHFESVWDALAGAGISVHEPAKNSPFDSGLNLHVLSFQPMEGLNREVVVETVKPLVAFQGRTLQTGQVIVGTPASRKEETSETKNSEEP